MLPPDEYTMWLERARTGKNVKELDEFYALLIKRVKRIDPITVAEMTDAEYKGGDGVPRIVIPFLHSWFVLELLPDRCRGRARNSRHPPNESPRIAAPDSGGRESRNRCKSYGGVD